MSPRNIILIFIFLVAALVCPAYSASILQKAEPFSQTSRNESDSIKRAGPAFNPCLSDSIGCPELIPVHIEPTDSLSGFTNFINSVGSFFQIDTAKKRRITFLALPEFSYSDNNGVGLGFTARMYINDYSPRPAGFIKRQSYVDLSGSFTFKGNMSVSINPTLYLLSDRLLIRGRFSLGRYPSTFRAIGANTSDDQKEDYDKSSTIFRLITYWRWFKNVYIGVGGHYYDYGVSNTVEGGMLEESNIAGSKGAKIAGLSLHYLYDSRDNQFVPMKGFYTQIEGYFNGKFMGSSEDYTKYIIDIRYYQPVAKNQLIAMNFYSQMSIGDVPFQDMALLSNGVYGRGYGTGRYIDKNLMSLQAEYRYYFGRFGVSAFASTSNVGSTPLKALKIDKFTYGAGLRFKPFRAQRMYFRADIGFNTHGDAQVYLGIDELF